ARAMPFRDDATPEGDGRDAPTAPPRSGIPPRAHTRRADDAARPPDDTATPSPRGRIPNPLRLFRKKRD
ncbi:hypothetical protein FVW20_16325, partial [Desulfovibrio oxamicus]|nr:hypothetical protein [Nitratidesulfovibrio oxamicus]